MPDDPACWALRPPSAVWAGACRLAEAGARLRRRAQALLKQARALRAAGRRRRLIGERRRIAAELHDGLGSDLCALAIQLEAVAEAGPRDWPTAARHLLQARTLVGGASVALRHALSELHTPDAEDERPELRPTPSLQRAAAPPTGAEPRPSANESGLCASVKWSLWRIGQEAITNAVKHSACRRLQLTLTVEPGQVRLVVADDGRGFNADEATRAEQRFGLRSIRAQALEIGAELRMESRPRCGTRVEVVAPVSASSAAGVARGLRPSGPRLRPAPRHANRPPAAGNDERNEVVT